MHGLKENLSMALGVHDHPFYRPKWRRVALVATTASWAAFEILYTGSGFWTVLASAVFVYCFWVFILNWKDKPPPDSSANT
jgi:hypothetical protein